MHLTEVRVGDVCINLRRVNRGVAEELLDRANVGTIREQVGGEGMSKSMRRDAARDTGTRHILFQMSLNIARSDAVQLVWSAVDEERFLHIFSRLQIFAHRLLGGGGDEDDAHLLTLTSHR